MWLTSIYSSSRGQGLLYSDAAWEALAREMLIYVADYNS